MVVRFNTVSLTLKDVLSGLTRRTQSPARSGKLADPPPYIAPDSRHFRYASFIAAGMPYDEACREVCASPRTAERWRTDLREVACRYFRRRVTYDFAARYVVDAELRRVCAEVAPKEPTTVVVADKNSSPSSSGCDC